MEQVQHILVDVMHVCGGHRLQLWVEAMEVSQQEPQTVSQLQDMKGHHRSCDTSEIKVIHGFKYRANVHRHLVDAVSG